MGSIYRFASQESLRQDIYLTQGVNETYGAFTCRVSGLQVKFAAPGSFFKRMSSESSNSSQGSFKGNFDYVSASDEYHLLPGEGGAKQHYYFHMRENTLKEASSRNNDRAEQTLIEQPELQRRYWETSDKQKKTVFQRLLSFLTRCFIPCIKVKT